jgi:dTDP-4-dehydrorhamnose 3,5-epimerase
MKFIETPLSGVYVIELEPFHDERGLFARTFCQKEFATIGFDKQIVQINHSITRKGGTIRGMHYQSPPVCEIKIIRCVQGAAFDVMVDLRSGSPTFLQWHGMELSKDNMRMVYIPEGFAHGFQTLADNAELIYHHSAFYSPEYESGLRYDDPALAIKWPLPVGAISPKDQSYPLIDNNFKGIEI